jgi:hypothetical protein
MNSVIERLQTIPTKIDLATETLVSLAEAAKSIPPSRNGRRTHLSTILRWILHGVDGVRLEGVRLGGRWLTSREALQRFAERLTPDLGANQPMPPRSRAARDRASARAEKELTKIGI